MHSRALSFDENVIKGTRASRKFGLLQNDYNDARSSISEHGKGNNLYQGIFSRKIRTCFFFSMQLSWNCRRHGSYSRKYRTFQYFYFFEISEVTEWLLHAQRSLQTERINRFIRETYRIETCVNAGYKT